MKLYLDDVICSFACFTGETIRIVIEDYVQHLSGYHLKLKFDPTLLFSTQFQYQNRIALEFNQLYHWHPLMPDSFFIDGTKIPYTDFMFNTSMLMYYGVEKLVQAFSTQPAGQVIFPSLLTWRKKSLIFFFFLGVLIWTTFKMLFKMQNITFTTMDAYTAIYFYIFLPNCVAPC